MRGIRDIISTSREPAPPDKFTGKALYTLIASVAVYVCGVGPLYCQGILLSSLLLEPSISSGNSLADMSFAFSFQSASFLAGALPAGYAYMFFGGRTTVFLGTGFSFAGYLLSSISTRLWHVQICSLLVGLGSSFVSNAVVSNIGPWFKKWRAAATGIVVSGSGIGTLLLGPIVQEQIDVGGFRQAMRFLAGFSAIFLILSAVFVIPLELTEDSSIPTPLSSIPLSANGSLSSIDDDSVPPQSPTILPITSPDSSAVIMFSVTDGEKGSDSPNLLSPVPSSISVQTQQLSVDSPSVDSSPTAPLAPPTSRLWKLLTYTPILLLYSFAFLYGGIWFVLVAHFNKSVREVGTSADTASLIVSANGFGNMVGRLLMGFGSDIIARWNISKLQVMEGSVLIFGLATLFLGFPSILVDLTYQIFFYGLFMGFFGGSITALYAPVCSDLVGLQLQPLAMGLFGLVQAPSALFFPPIVGAIRSSSGSYSGIWFSVGFLTCISVCLLHNIAKHSKSSPFSAM